MRDTIEGAGYTPLETRHTIARMDAHGTVRVVQLQEKRTAHRHVQGKGTVMIPHWQTKHEATCIIAAWSVVLMLLVVAYGYARRSYYDKR
jgi:hypothetical protein